MNNFTKVAALILQLLLVLMPFSYFFIKDYLNVEELVFAYGALFVFYVACMSEIVLSSVKDYFSDFSAEVESMKSSVSNIDSALSLVEEDFYDEFQSRVRRAKSIIYTAHLGGAPPSQVMENAKNYYRTVWAVLKRKRNVEIKRVELFTPGKSQWIKNIADKMSDKDGFSLWVIDGRSDPHVCTSSVSVQIVDDMVYLVALASHHDRVRVRDIGLKGEKFKSLWVDYYDQRLVSQGVALIHNGQLNIALYNDFFGGGK